MFGNLDFQYTPSLNLFRFHCHGWYIAWNHSPFKRWITVINSNIFEHDYYVLKRHPKGSWRIVSSKRANLLLCLLGPEVTQWVPVSFPLIPSAVFVCRVSYEKDKVRILVSQSYCSCIQDSVGVAVLDTFTINCSPTQRFFVTDNI